MLVDLKTTWMTGKNIVWFKINILDEFFQKYWGRIYWINLDLIGLTCQSVY
jgi:hypothetical protein